MWEKEVDTLCRQKLKRILHLSSPGWNEQPEKTSHMHLHREIFICLKGGYHFTLGDKGCILSPGDVVLCEPGIPHAFHGLKDDKAHLWAYILDDKLMARVLTSGHDISYSFIATAELCLQLTEHWKMGPEFMHGPLLCLLEELRYYAKSNIIPKRLNRLNIVEFLKEYIRNKNGIDCSLDKLARITNYSKYHLTHIFKKSTGNTIGSFIDQVRFSRTEQLLSLGKTQKEIAHALGFSSPSAFWKWYKNGSSH
ncbi:MAG: AraC family transcriptional regulator [Victivallales bacterium]|nr:AraC family transcriptional regulator [Victivallales bacterium]